MHAIHAALGTLRKIASDHGGEAIDWIDDRQGHVVQHGGGYLAVERIEQCAERRADAAQILLIGAAQHWRPAVRRTGRRPQRFRRH